MSATATVRTIIFAEDEAAAYDILEERGKELMDTLLETAGIPSNKYILVDSGAYPSLAVEMDPDQDEYIAPGAHKLDACSHPDHEH